MAEEDPIEEVQTGESSHSGGVKRLQSAHSGMESSVFKFKSVNFTVGKPDNPKYLLTDVTETVKWGRVLAIMGPSGAGKTTLISSLTLDALYGRATGSVTLNGIALTDKIFKQHCYVVKQHDKHWPYLTCRETLTYAAELYNVVEKADLPSLVDEIIRKMGMESSADTRNAALSGGQRRRLSIAIALLKQPTLLFLDEPTSGLDAAAASSIMQEIVRVAKEERIIVVCTIHQPSTKVYNGFDQLMIMSRGRQAYSGDVKDAVNYFDSIGYPCPPAMNPAEFFLDLVNSDFTDEAAVTKILDTWEEKRPDNGGSSHHKKGFVEKEEDAQEGVTDVKGASFLAEVSIMFRRQGTLIIRDPILYIGRCFVFLVINCIFSLVYLSARDNTQDQALNKFWVLLWFIAVPGNMGVVAVYALNDEFKSVLRESKNGMVTPLSYIFAKSVLTLPILFIFAIFAHGIPLYAIQGLSGEGFIMNTILYAAVMFVFESVAECLSVWMEDPILGMLQFMNFWFGCFLFGGFLIPLRDLYWPFELFYHIMPFSYYTRAAVYQIFKHETFESCSGDVVSAVCIEETDGLDVLEGLSRVLPLLSADNDTAFDLLIIIVIGAVYKLFYVIGVLYKAGRVSKFHDA